MACIRWKTSSLNLIPFKLLISYKRISLLFPLRVKVNGGIAAELLRNAKYGDIFGENFISQHFFVVHQTAIERFESSKFIYIYIFF